MTSLTANVARLFGCVSAEPEEDLPHAGAAGSPQEIRAGLARCLATVLKPLRDGAPVEPGASALSGRPPVIDLARTDMSDSERLARLAETMLVHGAASMAVPARKPDSPDAKQAPTVAEWLLSGRRSARIVSCEDPGGGILTIESRPRPACSPSTASVIELLVEFNGHRFESAMLVHGLPTRPATRWVPPSPVIRCPADQAARPMQHAQAVQAARPRSALGVAVTPAPPEPDFAALTELLGRMKAPTGVKGWWRRTVGPKAKPDEVVELARALARPAMAQWRARAEGRDESELRHDMLHWCKALFRECFEASSPCSRKRWASRVHGDGTGAFLAARQAQGRRLYEVLRDPRASRETVDQEVGTFMVLEALRAAAA